MREGRELLGRLNGIQRRIMTLEYLLSETDSEGRVRLEEWLDALESNPHHVIPAMQFRSAWEEADAIRVLELRQLRIISLLEQVLRSEEERFRYLCSELGVRDTSDDVFQRLWSLQKAVRTSRAYLTIAEFSRLVDVSRVMPRPVLSSTLVSFDRVTGIRTTTPERLFYRDMCWYYNRCLDDIESARQVYHRLRTVEEAESSKEFFSVASRAFRTFRTFVVSAVTLVESVVNGLHFEFLYSPKYESERTRLRSELAEPTTSSSRKELLAKLFSVDLKNMEQATPYVATEWKLKHLARFLSRVEGKVPDLNKPPFAMYMAVNTLWRNTFIHPSYDPGPVPRLPGKMREWLMDQAGGVPSRMWLFLDSAVSGEDMQAFGSGTADCVIEVIERLYELSFGRNHGLLWWLEKRGSSGRFAEPDDSSWLSDQFFGGRLKRDGKS